MLQHAIIKLSIPALACALLFSSCMKNLDTKPQTIHTDINDFDDLTAVQAGAYGDLQSSAYYGGSGGAAMAWSSLPDIMGDDFIEAYESLGDWENASRWVYAA